MHHILLTTEELGLLKELLRQKVETDRGSETRTIENIIKRLENPESKEENVKLPSLRNIEKVIKMVPIVKDLLPNNNNESESSLLKIIKNQEDALHDKKAEICKLRIKVKNLEQTLNITEELRTETEVKLGKAGGI